MAQKLKKQPTRIAEVINDLTLSYSLRPFWKFTHFTGILFDWCVATTDVCKKIKWTITILRWFIIPSSFIKIFLMFAYRFVQLLIAFRDMNSVNSITMAIVWFSFIPIAIHSQIFFIFWRRRILDFFQKFNNTEDKLAIHLPSQLNRLIGARRAMYGIFFFLTFCTLSCVAGATLTYQNDPPFYTSNHYLKSLFNSPFLISVSLLTDFLAGFFVAMHEVVPTLVYYHSGLALFAIDKKLKSIFLITVIMPVRNLVSTNDILDIWSNYNQVRDLISKADQLFGPIVVVNIGYKVLIACTSAYSALYYLFNKNDGYPVDDTSRVASFLSITFIVFILQLSTNVILSSNIQRASENLNMVTGDVYNRYWKLMEPETREVFRAFRSELENAMVAHPLNLFHITPSLLLNIMGLVVTYVIVLLQTK